MTTNQEIFQTFAGKYKQSFFNIVYQIIGQNKQSMQVSILLAAVQFFQLLYFPFQLKIHYAWYNEKLSSQIQEFLQYFTILRMLINQKTSLYLMVMYFMISLIILTTLLITILTIQKRAYNHKVIIIFLAKSIQFMMSIGFIEMLRILIGYFICTSDQNGTLRMLYLKDQECWVGDYVYHAIAVIIALLLFIFFLLPCNKLFIELRNNKKNTFSQRETNSFSLLYVHIIFSMIFYSLIKLPKYSICVIAIQYITSFIFFYRIYYINPFYNQTIQKIWASISGLVFHTHMMQLMTFLFNHVIIQNSMIGWLITCPMVVFILLGRQNYQIDLIKINLAKFQSTEAIIKDCEYLLELEDQYEKDQSKQIKVLGFLEMHEQTCLKPNCAIRINKNLSLKFQDNPKYTDERLILKELINQLYQDGLNRFPQSVDLKIHYSYFLYDHLGDGQKAFCELEKAEQLNPDFGQQFQIYSMKKTLEDSFQNTTFGVNTIQYTISIDRNIQFQQHQLKQKIQECSYQMIQFWNQLLEEIPNLSALEILGRKVLGSIHQIRKQITVMQQTNTFNSSTKKFLCKFSDYVFQIVDLVKFASMNINQQSDEDKFQSKFLDQNFLLDSQDLGSYSLPIIVLEIFSNNNQISIVKNINQATCSLLGFSKTDIIGHQISQLFQTNYSKLHHYLVQNYFASDAQDQLIILPQRQQFFQTKSEYVILTQSVDSIIQTEKGVLQVLRLTKDINYRNFAYLIFNQDGKIEDISSSCISILKLDIRKLQLRQLNIQQFFPNLLSDKDIYLNKTSKIEHDYHKSKEKSLLFEDYEKEELNKIVFMIQLFEISTNNILIKKGEVQQYFGYYLKVEQIEVKPTIDSPILKIQQTTKEFKFSLEQRAFIYGDATSLYDFVKDDCEIQEESKENIFIQTRQQSRKQNSMTQYRNQKAYGFDIKTLRLFQGEIQEVIDLNEEEEDEYNKEKTELQNAEIVINKSQSIKINSQNELILYLEKISYPTFLRRLILLNNILILTSFILSCTMYSTLYITFNKFQNAIELAASSNQRFSSLLEIQSNLQDLRGCNLNIEAYESQVLGENFVDQNFLELKNELNLLLETNNLLTSSDLKINKNYQSYIDQFEEPYIQMFSVDNSYQNFTYSQAVQQLIARAISLNSSKLSKFIGNNEDFHYFLHNTFNSIAIYQYVSQNYYFSNIYSLLDDLNTFENIFFILSSSCLGLIFIFCQLYVRSHQSHIRNIISAFLDIKEQYVKQIVHKIQNFIQILQTNEDDDVDQFDLEQVENQEEFELQELTKKSKKRKSQFSQDSENKIQIQILFVTLLFYSYFCYLYFSSTAIISYTNLLIPLVNITSYIPTQYRLIDNCIKEMFYDENAVIINEQNSINKLKIIIDQVQTLDAELHILNQKNEHILSTEYIKLFNDIYILNPCEKIIENDLSITNTSCMTFNENILQDGLAVAISNFFENACKMIEQYFQYDPNIIYQNLPFNLSLNHKKNYTYNILNTRESNDNRKMQKIFIRISHLSLIKELLNQLNDYYSFLAFQLTLLFMIFCIITMFTYFLLWIPILTNFYFETQKTLETLTIIPFDCLNKCEQIQEHLKLLKELQ